MLNQEDHRYNAKKGRLLLLLTMANRRSGRSSTPGTQGNLRTSNTPLADLDKTTSTVKTLQETATATDFINITLRVLLSEDTTVMKTRVKHTLLIAKILWLCSELLN
jgi:hypothetical protein